jgi:hypothetical protein
MKAIPECLCERAKHRVKQARRRIPARMRLPIDVLTGFVHRDEAVARCAWPAIAALRCWSPTMWATPRVRQRTDEKSA